MDKPRATPAVVPGAVPGSLRGSAVLMAAILIFTSACGGGGGGGTRDAADMGDVPESPVGGGGGGGGSRPPEPWQWGLGKIRAYQAYTRLADQEGSGVQPGGEAAVIGMLDTGIDQSHELLTGKTITKLRLDGAKNETGKRFSHGTAVASVIAGKRPSNVADRAHGVAWGGRLAVFAIPLGTPSDAPYNPASLTSLANNDAGDAAVAAYVLNWRTTGGEPIDFLNLSFGYSGLIDDYSETDLTTNYGNTIDALKQSDRAGSNLDKTILVWAAGNAHGRDCTSGSYCVNGKVVASSPEILPGLVARIAISRATASPSPPSVGTAGSPTSPIAAGSLRTGASPPPARTSGSPISGRTPTTWQSRKTTGGQSEGSTPAEEPPTPPRW